MVGNIFEKKSLLVSSITKPNRVTKKKVGHASSTALKVFVKHAK